jgi:hypothetical protein
MHDLVDPHRITLIERLTRLFHVPEGFIGKAFKGAAVVNLLRALDNAANGRLRQRPLGEIFSVRLAVLAR